MNRKTVILADAIYTVPEVAEILGLHPETVKRMIREGRIKAKRIGHGYKVLGNNILKVVNGEGKC